MKRKLFTIVLLMLLCLSGKTAFAAGTAAGTNIVNKATVTYKVGGPELTAEATNTIKVLELINVVAVWQDTPSVMVAPGDVNKILTYKVTNTGNGTEAFKLAANPNMPGDDFDPTLVNIYLDTNGNGTYDAGIDTLYTAGVNDPSLAADATVTIFVVCNIPAALADGKLGNVQFTATSKTGTGAKTVYPGAGDGGVDAIIGLSGGAAAVIGIYKISSSTVVLDKTAQVISDPLGNVLPNAKAVSGAVIRYTISASVTGSGTARAVVITDPVSVKATYQAGTLKLGGAPLTDAAGDDAGDFGITTAGAVTVTLGDMTTASGTKSIMFDVKIN